MTVASRYIYIARMYMICLAALPPCSCKTFNNLNSFMAIVIGLMNGAVTRLRETWKDVPLRTKSRLEQFQALTVSCWNMGL